MRRHSLIKSKRLFYTDAIGSFPGPPGYSWATPRDQAIVRHIQRLGIVTREQIERLWFPCVHPGHRYCCPQRRIASSKPARRRLDILCKRLGIINAYLTHRTKRINQGMAYIINPEYELNYQIAKLEADGIFLSDQEIKNMTKLIDDEITERINHATSKARNTLPHTVFLNDVYTWFRLGLKYLDNDIELQVEQDLVHREVRTLRNERPIPDAIFKFDLGGVKWTFYVEADRGTESLSFLRAKFIDYKNLLYGSPNEAVLFVGSNEDDFRRVRRLAEIEGIADWVFFSVYDLNHEWSAQTNALTDDVWITYGAEAPRKNSRPFSLLWKMETGILPGNLWAEERTS